MRTLLASLGTGPSLRTAPETLSSYSAPFAVQYAPPAPAAVIHVSVGSIFVLATTAPDGVMISSHSLVPEIPTVATTYVGVGAIMFSGRVRRSGEIAGADAGRATETVVVLGVCAATIPQPERTTSAAGMATAARVGVIESASVNLVE